MDSSEDRELTSSLLQQVGGLIQTIRDEARASLDVWRARGLSADFTPSATNLAHYLAFRHHDLRSLQTSLMLEGLSSLGRLESRVMPGLCAVNRTLARLAGVAAEPPVSPDVFFAGERILEARARAMFGFRRDRPSAFLITCPTEAGDDPSFMLELAKRHVEAIRINCAHDDAATWSRMIDHARAAERATGHRIRIFMDIAGPKIRTGPVRVPEKAARARRGDLLAIAPPRGLDAVVFEERHFAMECSSPEVLRAAEITQPVYVDDGKLLAEVERKAEWGLLARVRNATEKGLKLKPEKGMNFPGTEVDVDPVTEKDLADLAFIVRHADGVGFSFGRSRADVARLQDILARHRPNDWTALALILKIETAQAVVHLPEIVVQAAAKQPTAIMIARGDLALEIGFERTAEMQEEILWIGEAAHIPVIWATQVVERLIKKGVPSRGEMTDAAMSTRAECVMLNKGPHMLEAIDRLDTLLLRMSEHQHKKTPQLRPLASWGESVELP